MGEDKSSDHSQEEQKLLSTVMKLQEICPEGKANHSFCFYWTYQVNGEKVLSPHPQDPD